jgi:hypothetical protein
LHLALFFGCIAWYRIALSLASSMASGFALRFNLADEQPLFEAAALLFLVVLAICVMRIVERTVAPLQWSLGLPKRPTSAEEWATGAAMGWGVAVISVLAMLLSHSLHVQLWTAPRAFWILSISAASLALVTLSKVLVLYGYGFQHLIEGTGPVKAAAILVAIVTMDAILGASPYGTPDGSRVLVSAVGALLLCLCWLRTRGLWMGWGAWFGWAGSTTLIFGLPLGPAASYASVVDARAVGPLWLTGGEYGPPAARFLVLLLLAAIPLLVRITDEYAWRYTRRPIVPAGIPVDIPAPAAHAAMEESAPALPSLVQIQPVAPAPASQDVASD